MNLLISAALIGVILVTRGHKRIGARRNHTTDGPRRRERHGGTSNRQGAAGAKVPSDADPCRQQTQRQSGPLARLPDPG